MAVSGPEDGRPMEFSLVIGSGSERDGTKMRSGHFERGVQVGEWITYDKKGHVYKVTNIKPRSGCPS